MFSPQKEMVIMWCDGGVSLCSGGNNFAIYKGIKSTRCTPYTYTAFYVNYSSITGGGGEKGGS